MTTATGVDTLPWAPGLVRAYLLADPGFHALCGGRVSTRVPQDIAQPWVQVQNSGGFAVGGDPMLWSLLAQVDGWAPGWGASDVDPERVVWQIAADAARLLGRARNVTHENSSWRGRVVDGPLPDIDTKRGVDVPLFRASVRVELTVRVRPAL